MSAAPWIAEADLTRGLGIAEGEKVPDDSDLSDLITVLEYCNIRNHERKDEWFRTNVSIIFLCTLIGDR